jgi:hypothetical protein
MYLYYKLRPYIPRAVQIWLRRRRAHTIRRRHPHWPIPSHTIAPPANFTGWPQGKKFAFVLLHDVEHAAGQAKSLSLMQVDQAHGFRSAFNIVPERYPLSAEVRQTIQANGFEVGVHGLKHDGLLYSSYDIFQARAPRINHYLQTWQAVGVCSPASHHRLDWHHLWQAEYVSSTFDDDPFEPQADGLATLFPVMVRQEGGDSSYIELPYTLPQDHTLFIILQEDSTRLWQEKLAWIAEQGGMALLITHPDYMNFGDVPLGREEYPVAWYADFLHHVQTVYAGQFWQPLPRELAAFWRTLHG